MRFITFLVLLSMMSCKSPAVAQLPDTANRFQIGKDLLLAQFDCKTDVDDLHSVAAFATLLAHPDYSKVDFHAVAGTYGTQNGLYVPPNELFKLAFGSNWSDAHSYREKALESVKRRVTETLDAGGSIWIADAGQSDFSALLIQVIQKEHPEINTKERIHVVQHSNWNERVATTSLLAFAKMNANYHKIPDGNALGNGSPGFHTPGYSAWKTQLQDPKLLAIWHLAVSLGNEYNGKQGRYNNKAVASGGLDFSDLSETCYILGLESIKDTAEYFERFAQ